MKGSIQQRGRDTWRIIYDAPLKADGRRRRASETIHGNKGDAQKRLRAILNPLDEGNYTDPTRELVGDYLDRGLYQYGATNTSKRKQQSYPWIIERYLKPSIGGVLLKSLRPDHVNEMHQSILTQGLSQRTALHAHRALSAALNRAVKWHVVPLNVCMMTDAPKPATKEMKVLDADGTATFLEAAKGSRYHSLFVLMALTGLRRSEALALRWPEVDLDTGYISVVAGLHRIKGEGLMLLPVKTEKSKRRVSIPQTTVSMLRQLRTHQLEQRLHAGPAWQPGDYLFTHEDGRPYNPDKVSKEFTTIRKAAHLPEVRLHDMRHGMATMMIASGEHPKMVSERLGHSDVATTLRIYTHVLPGMQEEAAERLDTRIRQGNQVG